MLAWHRVPTHNHPAREGTTWRERMDDEITIKKPQLQAALLRWEQQARAGETMTKEEAAAMSAEEVATRSADALWQDLQPATV